MIWMWTALVVIYLIGLPITRAIIEYRNDDKDIDDGEIIAILFWPYMLVGIIILGCLLIVCFPLYVLIDGWIGRRISAWFKRTMDRIRRIECSG